MYKSRDLWIYEIVNTVTSSSRKVCNKSQTTSLHRNGTKGDVCKFEKKVLPLQGCLFYINEFRGLIYFGFDRDILEQILYVLFDSNPVKFTLKPLEKP